ncbi:uncharacterized protein MONOS_3482 [Monocercomonoides exilis]|uniref:uncharacterized protein n=1 Tax=Monocercomonoides exilis TaxID=2049356 RepID=UPI0035596037|nr:hypothetical protein MONOS_3482 [Monocercomonoides exilis]|eukprot:MONOS_3482.1-p1 / transcript=MONOS_3482.1 / gene=MONOS_3482 / organism=Monocercomonoides_exilis_PA203 / gene_product=unspecified product / transcript_product=unspecified product / location=Mono_scaffold00082:95144-96075(+) / protein_length=226 / sequence_SO=supercontig / SO=protein_coding / is_pseudo=false
MKDIIKLQEIESEVGDCDEASQELSKVEARLRSEIDDSSFNSTTQTGEKNIGEILQQSSGKSKEEIFVNLWEAIQGVSLLDGCYRRSSESSPIIQVDNEQQQSLEDSDMEKSECSLDKIVIEIIFRVFASFGQKQCPFEFYVKAAASDSVSKTPDFQLRFIEPSPQNLEFTEPFFKKFASENLLNSSSSEGTHSILSSLRSETDAIRLLHSHPPLKRDSVTLSAI